MRFDDLSRQPQPHPKPAEMSRRDSSFETFKDPRLILGSDSNPSIAHPDQGGVSSILKDHIDRVASAILQRIGEKVGDYHADPVGIPPADQTLRRVDSTIRTGTDGCLPNFRGRFADQLAKIDFGAVNLKLSEGYARDVQQMFDQYAHSIGEAQNQIQLSKASGVLSSCEAITRNSSRTSIARRIPSIASARSRRIWASFNSRSIAGISRAALVLTTKSFAPALRSATALSSPKVPEITMNGKSGPFKARTSSSA